MRSPVAVRDPDLSMLMIFLRTSDHTKYNVQNRFQRNKTIWDSLDEVLKEWRCRTGTEAKLSSFIGILRACNLETVADALHKEFAIEAISGESQNDMLIPTSKDLDKGNQSPEISYFHKSYPYKGIKHAKCIAFCCVFLPLVFLSACIISGTIYVAKLHIKI